MLSTEHLSLRDRRRFITDCMIDMKADNDYAKRGLKASAKYKFLEKFAIVNSFALGNDM